MDQEELKKNIREWIKKEKKLVTDLGELNIGEQLGEGGTAIVYSSEFAGGSAIKFLVESVSQPPTSRYYRFLSKYINLLKLVPSGCIVPLYYFGIQDLAMALKSPI